MNLVTFYRNSGARANPISARVLGLFLRRPLIEPLLRQ